MKTWKKICGEVEAMNMMPSRSTKIYLNIVFVALFGFFYFMGYVAGKCAPDYKDDTDDEDDDF